MTNIREFVPHLNTQDDNFEVSNALVQKKKMYKKQIFLDTSKNTCTPLVGKRSKCVYFEPQYLSVFT